MGVANSRALDDRVRLSHIALVQTLTWVRLPMGHKNGSVPACAARPLYRQELARVPSPDALLPIASAAKTHAASGRGATGGRVEHRVVPRFTTRCGSSLRDQNGSSTSITCWP
jgi:hypothetical protein